MKFKKLLATVIATAMLLTSGIVPIFAETAVQSGQSELSQEEVGQSVPEVESVVDVALGDQPTNYIRLWIPNKEFLDTDEKPTVYFYAEPSVYWFTGTESIDLTLLTDSLNLYNADTHEFICKMVDTGRYAADGDDIMGDGVYSCKLEIDNSVAGTLNYYAEFDEVCSDTASITIVKNFTDVQWAEMSAVDAEINKLFRSDEYSDMVFDARVEAMKTLLIKLGEEGTEEFPYPLIDSITYQNGRFNFVYTTGLECLVVIEDITDEFEYKVTEENEITITRYKKSSATYVDIPAAIGGLPVTSIGYDAFANKNIKKITLPDTLEFIDDYAFYDSAVSEINFPDSLVHIGEGAFLHCLSLAEVTLPNNPDLVIEDFAFGYYEELTGCIVEYMKHPYFVIQGYKGSSAEIYAKEHEIPFYTPENIADYEYTITDGEVTITKYNGEGGNLNLPHEIEGLPVTAVGTGAFRNCTGLETVYISSPITKIGNNAFMSCTELTSVDMANSVTTIGKNAFQNCTKLADVYLSKSLTEIGDSAFYACDIQGSITIPSGVKTIPSMIFYGNANLEEIKFDEGVESLNAVISSNYIKRVFIPKSVTSIDTEAFAMCPNLTVYGYADTAAEDYASGVTGTHGFYEFPFKYITKITLDPNGGDFGWAGEVVPTRTVYSGDVLPMMYAPTRLWYKFTGFFDEDGLMYYDEECEPMRDWDKHYDATLTAKWEVNFTLANFVSLCKMSMVNKRYSEDFDFNADGIVNAIDIAIAKYMLLGGDKRFIENTDKAIAEPEFPIIVDEQGEIPDEIKNAVWAQFASEFPDTDFSDFKLVNNPEMSTKSYPYCFDVYYKNLQLVNDYNFGSGLGIRVAILDGNTVVMYFDQEYLNQVKNIEVSPTLTPDQIKEQLADYEFVDSSLGIARISLDYTDNSEFELMIYTKSSTYYEPKLVYKIPVYYHTELWCEICVDTNTAEVLAQYDYVDID
jgi:hypothetical protein